MPAYIKDMITENEAAGASHSQRLLTTAKRTAALFVEAPSRKILPLADGSAKTGETGKRCCWDIRAAFSCFAGAGVKGNAIPLGGSRAAAPPNRDDGYRQLVLGIACREKQRVGENRKGRGAMDHWRNS